MRTEGDRLVSALKALKRYSRGPMDLAKDSSAHSVVVAAIQAGVDTDTLKGITGRPRQCIAAIRAHVTMGTYV